MVSLVWLQTELDSTQSYYHYLLRAKIIMSDLRSARKIWTALILRKINLRAAKSWFDSPSSRCWSSLTVPSCQTRETEIETHSVFFDWFENGRKFCKQDCAGLITMLSIFSWKRFRACKPPLQRNRFTKKIIFGCKCYHLPLHAFQIT